jgi:hypothetical protein
MGRPPRYTVTSRQIVHRHAHERADWAAHEVGEAAVGVDDRAVRRQGRGGLRHLLDQGAVGGIRRFEGENLLPVRLDEYGVYLSGPERAQRCVSFFEALAQRVVFPSQLVERLPGRGARVPGAHDSTGRT